MREEVKVLKREWRRAQAALVARVQALLAVKLNSEISEDCATLEDLRKLARRERELNAIWRQCDVLR